jgi:hypothetical protein
VQKAVLASSQKLPSAHPLFNHELKTIFQSQSNHATIVHGIATKARFMNILPAITDFQTAGTVGFSIKSSMSFAISDISNS